MHRAGAGAAAHLWLLAREQVLQASDTQTEGGRGASHHGTHRHTRHMRPFSRSACPLRLPPHLHQAQTACKLASGASGRKRGNKEAHRVVAGLAQAHQDVAHALLLQLVAHCRGRGWPGGVGFGAARRGGVWWGTAGWAPPRFPAPLWLRMQGFCGCSLCDRRERRAHPWRGPCPSRGPAGRHTAAAAGASCGTPRAA